MKIALLDTGVDLNHPDIQASPESIKGKYSCVGETVGTAVHDLDGHGTFVTSLILDYAPDAEIYVAKIANTKPANARTVAMVMDMSFPTNSEQTVIDTKQAITHAVDVWNVDIITMSFGFPSRAVEGYDKLAQAIKHAHYRDVLLFAAASNSGGQLGRAFPAREGEVVCVHSTDALGNRSSFSPTAVPEDVNLATVGEAVESAWPMHLCDADEGTVEYTACKSGTSYATPIMAGIAAFLLLYARLHLPESAHLLKGRRHMVALLQRIAQKGQGTGLRDGYYYVDLSLFEDHLFGKDKLYIDQVIRDVLHG